ncbi:MAG: methyltransferase domain-containing protein [Bacteroidota bacterium]
MTTRRRAPTGRKLSSILFVSHAARRCGVHQFGLSTSAVLQGSRRYAFIYRECSSPAELSAAVEEVEPRAIIYNYTPVTLTWLNREVVQRIPLPHVGILHEGTQRTADELDTDLFHYHIAPDPTLLLNNSIVYKTGRVIPSYRNRTPVPRIPTIGSFGFGIQGKGFDTVIRKVQEEFDRAVIRLHIPINDIVDRDGTQAAETAARCKALIAKPGIRLVLTHNFLSNAQLLDFLAGNTLNAFFYSTYEGRGISSVTDYALAVRRPLAISRSVMFRHLFDVRPSICIEDTSLRQIIKNGTAPLTEAAADWTAENLIWDYERIIDSVLSRPLVRQPYHPFLKRVRRAVRKRLTRMSLAGDMLMRAPASRRPAPPAVAQGLASMKAYRIAGARKYNRILDNRARSQYAGAIDAMLAAMPDMMSRKIPRAHIQQAFVMDTVLTLASRRRNERILAVGSYEDTAAHALRLMGFHVDMIDPILNYDLATFARKPSTRPGTYRFVIATSVLEHVREDESFVAQIGDMLAPGGIAVMTCDFNDAYRPGQNIPPEDFRLYTQTDIRNRLLPLLRGCSPIDTPDWECAAPDFEYGGCRYTFATLVVRKHRT